MGFWIFNLQLFWIQIEIRLFVFLFGLNDLNFVFANLLESWAGSLSWCLFIKHFVFFWGGCSQKQKSAGGLSFASGREGGRVLAVHWGDGLVGICDWILGAVLLCLQFAIGFAKAY